VNPLDALLAAAEAQVAAARTANAGALAAATEARVAAMAALDVDAIWRDPVARQAAAVVVRKVRTLDLRLRACGETVLAAFGSVDGNAAPGTYGRRGQYRGP